MEQAVVAYKNVVASKRFRNAERLRERARLDEIAALANAKQEGIEEVFTLLSQGYTADEAKEILKKKQAENKN